MKCVVMLILQKITDVYPPDHFIFDLQLSNSEPVIFMHGDAQPDFAYLNKKILK